MVCSGVRGGWQGLTALISDGEMSGNLELRVAGHPSSKESGENEVLYWEEYSFVRPRTTNDFHVLPVASRVEIM